MSRLFQLAPACVLLAAIGVAVLVSSAPGAKPESQTARLDTFVRPDGESFFALSLTPDVDIPAAAAHDVAVLFDTSASQTGVIREKAMQVLNALLAGLGPTDRVNLMAVDVNTTPLTSGFVSPSDEAMKQALAELEQRVPLGSTDMASALSAAAESFGEANNPRVMIYIGDGVSVGGMLSAEQASALVSGLVEKQVPVTGYAIGPRVDNLLLASVANHTGGMLLVDRADLAVEHAASFLAKAAHEQVVWPTAAEFPAALSEVFPSTVPPLRRDRDTVLIGKGTLSEPAEVKLSALVAGKPVELSWAVSPSPSNDDHAYLAPLVETARAAGPASTLPTLGTAGLREARRVLNQGADNLTVLGEQAIAAGNLDQAEHLAGGALQVDPTNPEALAVRRAVTNARNGQGPAAAELRLTRAQETVAPPPTAAPPVAPPAPVVEDAGLLGRVAAESTVLTDVVRTEVQATLSEVRGFMARDPDAALLRLKELQERVRLAPDVNPEVRAQVQRDIEIALREAARRQVEKRELDLQIQIAQQESEERQRINRQLFLRDQQVDQMLARFNSLMDEGRYRDAEQVAMLAREAAPTRPATGAAVANVQLIYPAVQALEYRRARWTGVVDTLATVERSHIPFPDEPPIIYPDPEVWARLTARRKAEYS
ncbi:MAG: VWA domain-containing protein, partial [Planctomycetes bacterium]|nr:VWA domain-containing protein [Planctomycetota bacterium]